MAHQPARNLLSLLGLVAWGDLGPLTLYKSKRGKVVAFAKTFPAKPPSAHQLYQRYKIRQAADKWQALSPTQRSEWNKAANRASLTMHGYNLWVHWQLAPDLQEIRTLERQTGTSLLPP